VIKRLTTSVIICTRNRHDCIGACLESIAHQSVLLDELIVVDSSDIPLIAQQSFLAVFNATYFPRTRLLYRHTKPGLPYQRNVGIAIAHADIIYFFDDDVVLEPDYIKEMQRIFAGHPKYAGGSGSITNIAPYKCTFRHVIRSIFLIQRNYTSGNFTSSGMPTHSYGTSEFKGVQVLGGCCCAYRSTIFNKHRFDEYLVRYAYMEDCDFSKRVSHDHALFYNPYAKLAHNQSPLNRENLVDFRTMFSHHYTYLFFKNFYPEKKLRLFAYLWSMTGLCLEAFYSSITQCSMAYIHGYCKGIYTYMRNR
jgi:GT2 family glycosyltransferase